MSHRDFSRSYWVTFISRILVSKSKIEPNYVLNSYNFSWFDPLHEPNRSALTESNLIWSRRIWTRSTSLVHLGSTCQIRPSFYLTRVTNDIIIRVDDIILVNEDLIIQACELTRELTRSLVAHVWACGWAILAQPFLTCTSAAWGACKLIFKSNFFLFRVN